MGLYREYVLPVLVDATCGSAALRSFRERAVEGLRGEVLEIGFGSGLNVPHYPPEVRVVYAVEPAHRARRMAEERVLASHAQVHHVGLDGARIPLPDASCDSALSTFTLCTIPDVEGALAEVHRVLRPGGTFHFLEHGLSPDAGVARAQRWLEPVQRRVADGCHLTRDAAGLVRDAGFAIRSVDSRYGLGPSPWSWLTLGVAEVV